MPKIMKTTVVLCLIITVITALLYSRSDKGIFLTLAVSFGTTTYHFGIRLLAGALCVTVMKNRTDYTKKRYQIHSWENKLYKLLKVKAWKNKMPTYNPEAFSNKIHTWDEIAQTMCQSETVHEINIILSFVPLTAVSRFGAFWVFFITSVCGAVFDLMFVIIQRYNRARVVKLALRQK
ncbi:MAG: hypothetical protein NC253_06130 [Ruminococcus sp.]|nr:hypothetical protein [Ruminococcus sp.]MCM1381433.1 hypothetical protein [Muribaculaceae bacterium]MCM1480261.1 hypothetical protein [Muribaculaceae bacterium]